MSSKTLSFTRKLACVSLLKCFYKMLLSFVIFFVCWETKVYENFSQINLLSLP